MPRSTLHLPSLLAGALGALAIAVLNHARKKRRARPPKPPPIATAPFSPPPSREGGGLLVISGANRGIGLATAAAFRDAGWDVLSLSRAPCAAPGAAWRATDLLSPGWGAGLREAAAARAAGRRVCVVHNAAVMEMDRADAMDGAALRRVLEVNVVAPALLTAALRPLLAEGSSIMCGRARARARDARANAAFRARVPLSRGRALPLSRRQLRRLDALREGGARPRVVGVSLAS